MRRYFCLFFVFVLLVSCEKEPGEGGRASITGRIFIENWNGNCTQLLEEYYGIEEVVYIIAGDDPSYFERIRTGPEGRFWFPYLRTGTYTVYGLSEECDVPGELVPVEVEVKITERKEQYVIEEDIVLKR